MAIDQIIVFMMKQVVDYPGEKVVTLNGAENKAMADQIATVDKRRLPNCAGSIDSKDMKQVERALKVQLGLPL